MFRGIGSVWNLCVQTVHTYDEKLTGGSNPVAGRARPAFIGLFASVLLLFLAASVGAATSEEIQGKCMTCHKEKTPGLYNQWFSSMHAQHNVTCYDCHGADRGDADAYMHEGGLIATLVTPGDCGQCHEKEADEFIPSYHAKAGQILDSNDAYLAHVVGGHPAAIAGCESCHGAKIRIDPDSENKLAVGHSWPNSGIGRINPDGTFGACNACHVRHEFSRAQVRQPETCGKCHLGPDHPQKEVYEESKHGIAFNTNKDKMNLSANRWVVGEDYYAGPTCATCHLSATKTQEVTHDAGKRISWTLRPPISRLQENWETKRGNMQDVCKACHGDVWVRGHYYQFDGVVNLYNEKFARPATEIMNIIRENGSLEKPAAFSNKLEWTYWELWHHEGRRARHGVAMMGPDYTWWHGIYEVGKHFYFKFVPQVRATGDEEAIAYLEKLLTEDEMHNWMQQQTGELKQSLREGELQKLYEDYFQPEVDGR